MSSSTAPRFRRLAPDRRESQILASAARHFGEKPYSAVSIAEIAADAGVVRSLVNHYFGNKRDLYLAVVRSMMFMPSVDSQPPIEGDVGERIAAAVDWLMTVVEEKGQAWLRVATAGGFGSDPEVQALLDEADDVAADFVLGIVGFNGEGRERESARAAIRAFGGLVRAMAREVIDRETISSSRARQFLSRSLAEIVAVLEMADDVSVET
ncbi:helix-turn-helix domain-containing protein [Nocardioides sp. NPDC127514]|uniref:TetR/AcrR family transcriptional regulator n=1 Tax=unclassified Nocardioides TaxID=2615069 RepID=UPI00332DA05A